MKIVFVLWFATLAALLLLGCKKVNEGQPPTLHLQVDKPTLTLGALAGSTDSFAIQTNTDWYLTFEQTTPTWLNMSATKGSGNQSIVLTTMAQNPADTARTAKLTLRPVDGASTKAVTVTITQSAITAAVITVSSQSLNVGGSMTAADSFAIQTAAAWTISNPGRYFDVSPLTGTGNAFIHIKPKSGNYSGDLNRIDTLHIYPTGTSRALGTPIVLRQMNGVLTTVLSKTFGGSLEDGFAALAKTTDGGFIAAGYTRSNDGDVGSTYSAEDVWVVKTDSGGRMQWQKTLGGEGLERATAIVQSRDGGYVIAGFTTSSAHDVVGHHGGEDAWVIKLDQSGSKVWQQTIGGFNDDRFYSIVAAEDGGYVVVGATWSNDGDIITRSGPTDALIAKLTADGSKEWVKTIGGSMSDYAYSVIALPTEGYVFAGTHEGFDSSINMAGRFAWVVKVNQQGGVLWQKTVGAGYGAEETKAIVAAPDGGYVLATQKSNFNGDFTASDVFLFKLSEQGATLWRTYLNLPTSADYVNSLLPVDDGYVMAATAGSNGVGRNGRVSKIDKSGNLLWSKQYGGSYIDNLFGVAEAEKGTYVLVGQTKSTDGDIRDYHGGSGDAWMLKIKE